MTVVRVGVARVADAVLVRERARVRRPPELHDPGRPERGLVRPPAREHARVRADAREVAAGGDGRARRVQADVPGHLRAIHLDARRAHATHRLRRALRLLPGEGGGGGGGRGARGGRGGGAARGGAASGSSALGSDRAPSRASSWVEAGAAHAASTRARSTRASRRGPSSRGGRAHRPRPRRPRSGRGTRTDAARRSRPGRPRAGRAGARAGLVVPGGVVAHGALPRVPGGDERHDLAAALRRTRGRLAARVAHFPAILVPGAHIE